MNETATAIRALNDECNGIMATRRTLAKASNITMHTYWRRYESWPVSPLLYGHQLRDALREYSCNRLREIASELNELNELIQEARVKE